MESLALAAPCGAAAGAGPAVTVETIRCLSAAYGATLPDDRLPVLQPVLEHRRTQLQALREFEIAADVEPTPGILA